MDTETLRTFLEVNRTRHFARAAENLFITQAAVSARIRQLEETLGARLFSRQRNNIRPTPAGRRLIPHAEAVLSAWNRARLETGAGEDRELVAFGCLPSLWEIYFGSWLGPLYGRHERLVLQVELLSSVALIARAREQSLDLAVLYEPPRTPDLHSRPLGTLDLMLVSTVPDGRLGAPLPPYVYVDWGTSFAVAHDSRLPGHPGATLRVDSPGVALGFLRQQGGTAYLPRQLVADDLAAGRLFTVAGAPVVARPVYVLHQADVATRPVARPGLAAVLAELDRVNTAAAGP